MTWKISPIKTCNPQLLNGITMLHLPLNIKIILKYEQILALVHVATNKTLNTFRYLNENKL